MNEIVNKLMKHHRLDEMARIGYLGNYEIIVWTDDPGNIPHFHVRDKNTRGEKFNSCIKIEVPEYFLHEGKKDKLNSKERKGLVNFLISINDSSRYEETNWQVILTEWNRNNSLKKVDLDQVMPDYLELL